MYLKTECWHHTILPKIILNHLIKASAHLIWSVDQIWGYCNLFAVLRIWTTGLIIASVSSKTQNNQTKPTVTGLLQLGVVFIGYITGYNWLQLGLVTDWSYQSLWLIYKCSQYNSLLHYVLSVQHMRNYLNKMSQSRQKLCRLSKGDQILKGVIVT